MQHDDQFFDAQLFDDHNVDTDFEIADDWSSYESSPPSVADSTELVNKALLEVPGPQELRDIDRDATALLLDAALQRVSGYESAYRLKLGALARSLLDTRAHHALGFAQLRDYTMERLGICHRELQTAAQVARAVQQTPELATAFRTGRLSWSKLRALARLTTSDNPPSASSLPTWIERASMMTVAELDAAVAAASAPTSDRSADPTPPATAPAPGPGPAPSPAPQSLAPDDETIDGEARLELTVHCPPKLHALWKRAHEMASRSAGAALSSWQALELIAAEALSARPTSQAQADYEPDLRRLVHEPNKRRDKLHDDSCTEFTEEELASLRELIAPNDPSDDFVLGIAKADTVPEVPENPTTTPHDLDHQLRATLKAMQRIDWQMGRMLRSFSRLSLHRNLGYASFAAYVTDRIGISPRKARALTRLIGNLDTVHSAVAEAYRDGDISWVRATALLPVAESSSAEAWTRRAGKVTLRRLLDEIGWAQNLRLRSPVPISVSPPPPGIALDDSDEELKRQICSHYGEQIQDRIDALEYEVSSVLRITGPASVITLARDAIEAFHEPGEHPYEALERILIHVVEIWSDVPRHRNPIHDRDGWRCRVPACSARRNLQEHHIVFRSRGGDNSRSNRVSICAWHHLRGIHEGLVRATGDAEGRIHWQLGIERRRNQQAPTEPRALLSTVDEAYAI